MDANKSNAIRSKDLLFEETKDRMSLFLMSSEVVGKYKRLRTLSTLRLQAVEEYDGAKNARGKLHRKHCSQRHCVWHSCRSPIWQRKGYQVVTTNSAYGLGVEGKVHQTWKEVTSRSNQQDTIGEVTWWYQEKRGLIFFTWMMLSYWSLSPEEAMVKGMEACAVGVI